MNRKRVVSRRPRSLAVAALHPSSFTLHPSARGFTLVEVLIATVLTLLLMVMVVQVFAMVGNATADTRAVLEMNERLRNCKITLQADLANVTARMLPPLKIEEQAGYFEYLEGPMGPVPALAIQAVDSERGIPDSTVGDIDDVLMFTTRNESQPFYGRFRAMVKSGSSGPTGIPPNFPPNVPIFAQFTDTTTTSPYAEVCYFVRGNTLYRRVLLVLGNSINMGDYNLVKQTAEIHPGALSSNCDAGFSLVTGPLLPVPGYLYDHSYYDKYDVSVRQVGGTYDNTLGKNPTPFLMANSLGDLTRRENRYGHQPHAYPYDARFWGPLGLPTLRECTFYTNITAISGGTAHWPLPFYDPNYTPLPQLWGSVGLTPPLGVAPNTYPNGPYVYPYSAAAANYQNYYLNANQLAPGATPSPYPGVLVPGTNPPVQHINLTQGGAQATTLDCWLTFPSLPLPPTYAWDQVSPFNGAIAAFSLSPDETDPAPPPGSQYDGSTRVSDDVILTNVISFDVKAWDPNAPVVYDSNSGTTYFPGDGSPLLTLPGYLNSLSQVGVNPNLLIVSYGAYVDLNYQNQIMNANPSVPFQFPSLFSGPGYASSLPLVYDTGCFAYEEDGIDQDGVYGPDQYTNGFDDDGKNGIDDLGELEGPIPYPVPLKGIQVKIRVFEPDSRQIREITVVEDFLWE